MTPPKFYYKCITCDKEYTGARIMYLCDECQTKNNPANPPAGVLKTLYHYDLLTGKEKSKNIRKKLNNSNFIQLLPIDSVASLPTLRIGKTPLYKIDKLNDRTLSFELFLKDDSQNPTFSFKDRASQIVSAFAKEHDIDTIAAASTGNAGSSLAGICAAQRQKAIIFVPSTAPRAKLTQIAMYGATVIPVEGTYDDAFDLSIEATKRFGWYNRNTAFNPLTIEGKKTVSFELFNQMNDLPDRIFVPVGDGVILSGVYKGYEDLYELGLVERIPVIVAVQAEGSCNIVRNLDTDSFTSKSGRTFADSISVDIPRNYYMAKSFIRQYHGESVIVSDDEIRQASGVLSRNTGIFSEPAAAAAFAGMLKYMESGEIPAGSGNVVLLTGCGLKDIDAVQPLVNIPGAVKPVVQEVERLLYGRK
ncbi:MAG: threonine synthase [Bacteroidetes bacterium]|nr:threonine synthase [Bacteroidota bacterium]